MASSSAKSAADPLPWHKRPAARAAGYAFRGLVVALVVYLGWSAATTFTSLVRDERAESSPTTGATTAAAAVPLDWAEVIGGDGSWQFGDGGWSVRVGNAADADVAPLLSRPIADTSALPPLADGERAILTALVPELGTRRERDGGTDVTFDSPSLRFVVRTRDVDGVRRLVGGRAALRRGPHEWTLIDAKPQSEDLVRLAQVKARGDQASAHDVGFLPYPPDAQIVATRVGDAPHGALRVPCQFVRTSGTLDDLLVHWRRSADAQHPIAVTPVVTGAAGLQEVVAVRDGLTYRLAALPRYGFGTTILVARAADASAQSASSPSSSAP